VVQLSVGPAARRGYGAAVPRGRPRSPDVDAAVLAAVCTLVADGGYDAVTVEAVAKRAGVARTTVYRRWATPAELVLAAFSQVLASRPVPDTGSLAGDLRALATSLVEALERSIDGPLTRAAVAAAAADPEHFAALVAPAMAARRGAVAEVVERAHRRGEVDDATVAPMVELVVGAVYLRYLVTGQELDADTVDGWLACLRLPGPDASTTA
jgi:AcrR family transcriptional regulator